MSDVPDSMRRQVIREVYHRADALGWDTLSMVERTARYNLWLDDEDIGGVLTRYMPRERARMWLKDVPMKHYNRARSGIGPYADLVRNPLPSAAEIAASALGEDWTVVDGSVQEKPNRCRVTRGATESVMFWGNRRSLQNLVWAGLNIRVDGGPTPILILTLHQGERVSDGERERHRRLCELAGLKVRHITIRPSRRGRDEQAGALWTS